MQTFWRVFADCKREKGVQVILATLGEKLDEELHGVKIEPYQKGGFVLSFSTIVPEPWPESVLLSISLVQRVAGNLQLSGNVAEELDLWSNHANVPGVQAIHCFCQRINQD